MLPTPGRYYLIIFLFCIFVLIDPINLHVYLFNPMTCRYINPSFLSSGFCAQFSIGHLHLAINLKVIKQNTSLSYIPKCLHPPSQSVVTIVLSVETDLSLFLPPTLDCSLSVTEYFLYTAYKSIHFFI